MCLCRDTIWIDPALYQLDHTHCMQIRLSKLDVQRGADVRCWITTANHSLNRFFLITKGEQRQPELTPRWGIFNKQWQWEGNTRKQYNIQLETWLNKAILWMRVHMKVIEENRVGPISTNFAHLDWTILIDWTFWFWFWLDWTFSTKLFKLSQVVWGALVDSNLQVMLQIFYWI